MGGALCVDDPELGATLQAQRTAMGATPGSLEVWLLLRSLRTLPLRLDRHCANATALAAWLDSAVAVDGAPETEAAAAAAHPLCGLVRRVWHPSLPHHPGHEIATRQMKNGFGAPHLPALFPHMPAGVARPSPPRSAVAAARLTISHDARTRCRWHDVD
jgi:cystathionine gamma-synthase